MDGSKVYHTLKWYFQYDYSKDITTKAHRSGLILLNVSTVFNFIASQHNLNSLSLLVVMKNNQKCSNKSIS